MKKTKLLLMALLILSVPVVGLFARTNAQSNGLGVTPRKDYVVKPGETIKDNLFIGNLSKDQALKLKAQVVDFKAQDETGAPSLIQDPNQQTRWSIKPFITFPQSIDVPAGQSAQIPISITVPSNQGAGSYYSAIKYEVTSGAGGNVSVLASSASLIFVKVPGETKQLLKLEKFGTYVSKNEKEGTFKKLFSKNPPSEIAYRLKNDGNIAEQPAGSILIKDSFGKNVKVIEQINPKDSLVLLGQTRKFVICAESEKQKVKEVTGSETEVEKCKPLNIKPGRYKMEMTLLYGENGTNTREINAKSAFWYLPAWFVIVVILGVALISFGAYTLYKKYFRSFKRHRK